MAASYDASSPEEQYVPLPSAPLVRLDDHTVLQRPLTRRGKGPGIVIILPDASQLNLREGSKPLDPEPTQKWAEEGFVVVAITGSPLTPHSTIQTDVTRGIDALLSLGVEVLDIRDKFAIIVYDDRILSSLGQITSQDPRITCIAGYSSSVPTTTLSVPTLLHLDKNSSDPDPTDKTCYRYTSSSPSFVLPHTKEYAPGEAAIAHSRTLVFLRKWIGGPHFDIEVIWDEHTYFEFGNRSVAKTMGTMVAEPYVNHIPTMTGGIGRENLFAFYRDHFIFVNPADARLQTVSRTIGPDRIVDEFIYHLTHDRTVDWLLPGVPPTGMKLSIPMMAVVNVRGDRLYNEHIWWDQATVLRQAGILPTHLPFQNASGLGMLRLPVAGVESAHMLLDESTGKSNEMFGGDWGLQNP